MEDLRQTDPDLYWRIQWDIGLAEAFRKENKTGDGDD